MLNFIDGFLNKITMYRLVFYYLIALIAITAVFGAIGILPYSPVAIVLSLLVITLVTSIINTICAAIFKAHPNTESVYITAFILTLVITPGDVTSVNGIIFLVWVAVIAMASKYVLAIDKKHIFNPVAIALVIAAFVNIGHASWWIGGNIPMMTFVVIGGLLVLRKIQRFDLAFTFFVAALISDIVTHASSDPVTTVQKALLHTPILFFAFIMLTEPATDPPTRTWRIIYGALVGAIFSPFIHIGSIYSTPELALVVGNIFSYGVSPKGKRILKLKEKNKLTPDIQEFIFETDKKISFRSGQYLEWTLSHDDVDLRGNRRYFTIASAPTEHNIRLGVKFHEPSSTFKKKLIELKPGDTIMAGQLAGDFTLPKNLHQKLAFIAGGIGVTPFRSMAKDLADREEKRDIIFLYSNSTADDIAYREIFDEAGAKIGMKTIYVITSEGRITTETIKKDIPDYRERTFYISGTRAMTSEFKDILMNMGVARTQIKIDFFPGFA